MKINENYKIEAIDERNVVLIERKVPKTEPGKEPKKPYWKVEGYYPSVNFALKGLVTKEINSTGLKSLKKINDKIKELHEMIDNLGTIKVGEVNESNQSDNQDEKGSC